MGGLLDRFQQPPPAPPKVVPTGGVQVAGGGPPLQLPPLTATAATAPAEPQQTAARAPARSVDPVRPQKRLRGRVAFPEAVEKKRKHV